MCARARANKRVTFRLSDYELKAARLLELWRLTLDAIGARSRLVEAEETDEATADGEVDAHDDEMVIVDAVVVNDSDPTWNPAGGSGESDSSDGSAERVAEPQGSADEPAAQDVQMTERATLSPKRRLHRMTDMLPLLPAKRGPDRRPEKCVFKAIYR